MPRHVRVQALTSFNIEDSEFSATRAPDAIYHIALDADRPNGDAFFISCTAIRAGDVLKRIEDATG